MLNKLTNSIICVFAGIILLGVSILILSGAERQENESDYYENIDFDFIIPRPWYSQISEIENFEFIDAIVPYYMTAKDAYINGKKNKVDFYLFEKNAKISKTPYNSDLLISGKMPNDNEAVIDETTHEILNAEIGDELQVVFGTETCKFNISGIIRSNKFSSKPTAMVYFVSDVKTGIENSIKNLAYSGAYVDAKDVTISENYFNTEYRAKGKIGERSWYESNDSYEYMKKTIEEMSVAKEITNVASLKANSLSTYREKTKDNLILLLSAVGINVFLFILIWVIYLILSSKSYSELVRDGKITTSKLISNFRFGAFLTFISNAFLLYIFKDTIGITSFIVLVFCNFVVYMWLFYYIEKKINKKNK